MIRLRPTDTLSRRHGFLLSIFACATLFAAACSRPAPEQPLGVQRASAPVGGGSVPAFAQNDDGQWLMPAKDYASTRYSTLDEINTTNVQNLKLSWTFSTG